MADSLEDLAFAVAKEIGCPTAPMGEGWELTIPIPGGRSQALTLQSFFFEEEPFVRISTRVGGKDRLPPGRIEQALGMNCCLPHGCLAIEAGYIVMTDTIPLSSATPALAASILRCLSRQADLYEHVLFKQDVH